MKALAWAAIDCLGCLLLVILTTINPPVIQHHSNIDVYGRYVVQLTWPAAIDSDIDLWVRDPAGKVVWWGAPRQGLMNLEQDDLGKRSDLENGVLVGINRERVILRGVIAGEYIVNVHAYRSDVPVPVVVTLWRLQGTDRIVYTRKLMLRGEGDEQTAFRFSLTADGRLVDANRLPYQLVGPSS